MRRLILLFGMIAVASAQTERAESPGPTILSRGLGTALQGGGELLRLRPYLSLTGNYDTGLTPVSTDATGRAPDIAAYGGQVGLGLVGYHNWRRTVLGIDYRGNIRHYPKYQYYDGSDHSLTLGVTHRPTRRLEFTLREAAGSYSRSNGMGSSQLFFDPAYANVPTNEMFDGRTTYLSTMGDLTFNQSPRLSFNIGGTGWAVRRRSSALIGMTGWSTRGDVSYRLSRTVAIGADYGFSHYGYTGAFGASDIHSTSFDLSARLGRHWDLGIRGGGSRIETLGMQRFSLDPILAAIIGRTTVSVIVHRVNYIPSGEVKLSRVFRRSSFSAHYLTGANPGNGFYLTSRSQSASADYSYTAFRRWNFGIRAGYDTYSALTETMGKYQNYSGGGGVTCQVKSWFHIIGRYDARRYNVTDASFRRLQHSASLGVAFSPGEFPLSLW